MAALSLDARRVAQGRLDLAPWMTRTEDSDSFEWYVSCPNSAFAMQTLMERSFCLTISGQSRSSVVVGFHDHDLSIHTAAAAVDGDDDDGCRDDNDDLWGRAEEGGGYLLCSKKYTHSEFIIVTVCGSPPRYHRPKHNAAASTGLLPALP